MGTLALLPSRTLAILKSATLPGANATVNYLPIWPWVGWGTTRIWVFTDQQLTLNLFAKPARLSATSLVTFRQIATRVVPASGTTMEAYDLNVRSDYGRIQVVTTTAPTVFEIHAILVP